MIQLCNSTRSLVTTPDPVLQEIGRSLDVTKEKDYILELQRDMEIVMNLNKGIGLTAHQVGEPADFFVVSRRLLTASDESFYFINARIVGIGKMQRSLEGCLSIPGKIFLLKRYPRIEVTRDTLQGARITSVFEGRAAVCIQHEHDHTRGIILEDIGEEVDIDKLMEGERKGHPTRKIR